MEERGQEAGAAKREARARAAERLAAMTPEQLRASSDAIARSVLSSPQYRTAETVFLYVSVGREPDTRRILRQALEDGKKVYVPKCGAPPEMRALRLKSPGELIPGRMGIPEPPEGEEAERVDLALVPCVSASQDGRRLGHGGGYYDRFLGKCGTYSMCLCHRALLDGGIPVTPLDIPVDEVVTGEESLFPEGGASGS